MATCGDARALWVVFDQNPDRIRGPPSDFIILLIVKLEERPKKAYTIKSTRGGRGLRKLGCHRNRIDDITVSFNFEKVINVHLQNKRLGKKKKIMMKLGSNLLSVD